MDLRVFGLLSLVCSLSCAADWPRFRGPNGSGVADAKNLPVEWDDDKNIRWKTALPGPGVSSPVVWGDNVYVTCFTG
jgi:hypothetical protein